MSKLILAIPSKGRLKEQTDTYLREAGLKLKQTGGDRGYAAELRGIDGVEIQLLSAGEIARGLISGAIHLGVTGEDLLRESVSDLESLVHLLKPLGFGFAKLIVAAPKSWIDVETIADLNEVGAQHQERTGRRMRVATKYTRLAREFFAAKGVGHYRIVESAGATEGAPMTGAADLIVDITTTGATLEANGLKIIPDGQILASQAMLAASLKVDWTTQQIETLRVLLDYIEARQRAKDVKTLRFAPELDIEAISKEFPESNLGLIGPGQAFCAAGSAQRLAQRMSHESGKAVRIHEAELIFEAQNTVFKGFLAAKG